MKNLKKIYALFLLVLIFSCSKEDGLGNLEGSWTFGSYFIDGIGGTANGVINFVEGEPCTVDIWYVIPQDSIANDTIFLQGEFTFRQTEELLTIIQENETSYWTRAVNKKDEQEFHFEIFRGQRQYDIIFDLIPE